MSKQKAYLLVGLPHTGVPLLAAALAEHRDALADQGVRAPATSVDEMFNAAVEVRREHRAWGLRRKDVEGSWARITRRALKHGDPVVVGHDLLAGASADEVALLADGLRGLELHVVVVAGPPDPRVALFPDELELIGVLDRWEGAVSAPEHVHVLVGGEPWAALGALVGFDAAALPLPELGATPADAASLRLLAEAGGVPLAPGELVDLAEQWAKVVEDRGYAVTGDLAALTPQPAPVEGTDRVAVLSEALVEAVAEIGRLREQLQQLEPKRRSVRLPGVLVRGA